MIMILKQLKKRMSKNLDKVKSLTLNLKLIEIHMLQKNLSIRLGLNTMNPSLTKFRLKEK
jgi:hypothetical protein